MQMKQSNHHFSFKISINSTIEKVWEELIDVPKWHTWDTELIDATLEGHFMEGAQGIMIPKTGPKLKFYITAFSPHKSYTINTKMPIGELVIKRTIKSKNGKIAFTDDIEFTGFLKYIFGFMLGGKFRNILPEVLNNFKQIVEAK